MDEKLREDFAKNLKVCMEAAGKKQIDLCHHMHVSSATVSDWCNGVKLPRVDKIVSLSNYLNVDMSELISNQQKSVKATFEGFERILNEDGLRRLSEYAKLLSRDPEYTKKSKSHETEESV